MIEGIELLRELKDVLGEVRGLCGGDALVDYEGSLRSRQPEFPKIGNTSRWLLVVGRWRNAY